MPDAEFVLLHTLPTDHPLRSAPLLGAQCRNHLSKVWRDVEPSWAIAKSTFNRLDVSWTAWTEFRMPQQPQPQDIT